MLVIKTTFLKKCIMRKVKVQINWLDKYVACSDSLNECVVTHRTYNGVKRAYSASLSFQLEEMRYNNVSVPEELQGNYLLEYELTTKALLHYFDDPDKNQINALY